MKDGLMHVIQLLGEHIQSQEQQIQRLLQEVEGYRGQVAMLTRQADARETVRTHFDGDNPL